jgi:hypothetical protein
MAHAHLLYIHPNIKAGFLRRGSVLCTLSPAHFHVDCNLKMDYDILDDFECVCPLAKAGLAKARSGLKSIIACVLPDYAQGGTAKLGQSCL